MATHLTVTATHDGPVGNRELREALCGIDADDLSQSSPVDHPARMATVRDDSESEDGTPMCCWQIRSGERDEDVTKKTTDAIEAALRPVDGITDVSVNGGYEPAASDDADVDKGCLLVLASGSTDLGYLHSVIAHAGGRW